MSADSLQDNLMIEPTLEFLDDASQDSSLDAPQDKKELQIKELLPQRLKYIGKITDYKSLNPKENTLIIAASALKCISILAELKYLKRRIGKLFSRHLKLSDQQSQLSEYPTKINVGTPNRICKLLPLLKYKKVILDLSSDVKGFSLLDLKDTRRDLLHLIDNLEKGRVFIKI